MKKKIEDVAKEYIELKDEESLLKDKLSPVSSFLKKEMEKMFKENKDTIDTGIGIVKLTYRKNKAKYDEEGLIKYLKEKRIRGVVKKKEYVDFDVLESLLYNDKVDPEEIAKFKKQTTTPVLNIKRKKGE